MTRNINKQNHVIISFSGESQATKSVIIVYEDFFCHYVSVYLIIEYKILMFLSLYCKFGIVVIWYYGY